MTQYRVTISHDACTVHDVESCSPEEAAERAMESCGSVTLCHHCSDELQMGDPIRAACVENLEDGTHIDAVDPELTALREQKPLTEEQIAVAFGWKQGFGPLYSEVIATRVVERAHGIGQPANKPGATK